REITGAAPLVGCSGEGVITQAGSVESSHVVAAMAIRSDDIFFDTFAVPGLGADSRAAGRKLAEAVAPLASASDLLVLFADGVVGNCRELLAALDSELAPDALRIVGGTAGDLMEFTRTYQYRNDQVYSGAVTALLVRGAFEIETVVSHGCDLVGEPQTITKTDGCFVEEIDDRRAWD